MFTAEEAKTMALGEKRLADACLNNILYYIQNAAYIGGRRMKLNYLSDRDDAPMYKNDVAARLEELGYRLEGVEDSNAMDFTITW